MEFIKTMIFEDPMWFYVLMGVVVIPLVGLWWSSRAKRYAIMLCIPIALAVGVAVVEHLVITDRELITQILEDVASNINNQNYNALKDKLDDEFSVSAMNMTDCKDKIDPLCKNAIKANNVQRLVILRADVKIESDGIIATVSVGSLVITDLVGNIPVSWTLTMRKNNDQWHILDVLECNINDGQSE